MIRLAAVVPALILLAVTLVPGLAVVLLGVTVGSLALLDTLNRHDVVRQMAVSGSSEPTAWSTVGTLGEPLQRSVRASVRVLGNLEAVGAAATISGVARSLGKPLLDPAALHETFDNERVPWR